MIYHFQYKKENHPKLSQICSYGIFSKGLKEFETAVVNKPSVFEPLKFYCNLLTLCSLILSVSHLSNFKYSLLEARHARSITNAKGVAFSNIDRAFRSWATSKILDNLVWSCGSPRMYHSAMECMMRVRMVLEWP